MSCVAVCGVVSLSYKWCWMELEGKELPGQKASVLGAEMGLVCSCHWSLMVLGKSLPLAIKQHRVCQKM